MSVHSRGLVALLLPCIFSLTTGAFAQVSPATAPSLPALQGATGIPDGSMTTSPVPSLPPPDMAVKESSNSGNGLTQNMADVIRSCQVRLDSTERLGCYDTMANSIPSLTAIGHSMDTSDGLWIRGKDSAGVAASSVDSNVDNLDKGRAALYVKCREHQEEIYVSFDHNPFPNSSPADVNVKLDGSLSSVKTAQWVASQSGSAVGLWSSNDTGELIKLMAHSSRISIRVSFPVNKFVIAAFEIKGVDAVLGPVLAACATR